jgi:hypothetical protein
MKQKKFNTKLALNKFTVTHLKSKKMNHVKRGNFESMECWPTGEPVGCGLMVF